MIVRRNNKALNTTIALAFAITASGCGNVAKIGAPRGGAPATAQPNSISANSPQAQLSPAELQLKADGERFNNTVFGGVVTGALIGAAAGGVFAILSGANKKQAQKAVLYGAAGGALLGGVDGYATAKKQAAGNNEVRAIQASVADLQKDNSRLQQFIASSDLVLNDGRQRLATLRNDVRAGKVNAQQAEDARKREETNIALMKTQLEKAKETRTQYAQAGDRMTNKPANRRDLDQELVTMDKQIARLEGNFVEYNRALAVSKA